MIKKILIITIFLQTQRSEWLKEHQYAQKDTLMNNMQVKNDICQNTDYMINSYLSNKAYYINCTTPLKNYITLNSNTNQVYNCDYEQCKFYCQYKCLISFDLYYQGIWMNNLLEFQIYKYNYIYYHTSNNYQLNKDFCDDSYYEIQQINITHSQVSILNFTISTNIVGNGQVSLRNIHILNFYYNCYPKCQTCSGPENNQCSSCFYGIQENQICPPCPFNQYYVQYKGCFPKCNFIEPLCLNGFCKLCQSSELFSLNLQNYTEWVFWSVIYDHQIQDTVPQVFWFNQLIYGILKNNSGISRLILEIVPKIGYYVGLSIQLIFFDELPPNCGIHIKFNRTYYGSIFNTSSGIRLHNFTTSNCTKYEYSYQQYQNYQLCEIYGYFDIPQYPFLFTAIGNLTYNVIQIRNPQVGWAMMGIQITSDYCTNYCLECDISYKCKICEIPYLLYRDGTCIQECNDLYQKNNGSYCKDFDDETQYSELLIKENIIQTFEYNSQYNLIHQNGNNFLKGQNIHYSFWNGFLIFGGAYVWAQAKFERILQIDRPHHSVSIAFYILYGPEFPSDSQFIITIQQSYQIIKYKSQAINQNDDGTFIDIVSEKRIHQQNVLNITFECKGENNEPIKAFCGLYNFYLAVHYCQPYCRQCIDQQSCQDWNRTDYLTQIQFSQADCQIKQYFDIHTSLCISCPLQCKRCTSKFSCQECENSYRLTNLGCFCAKNQYEELNQCQDCPLKCNQCLSNTFCFECVDIVNMRLVNGLCECIDGYSWDSNINKCHSDCTSNCPQECQNECIQCILGKCYECENEWYVDPIKNICIEKCGDFIQLPNEQCETSFILPYKGCQNCKPRCQSTCSNCSTSGIGCLECIEGYSLIDNLCYSICGDMIITVDEQCDDGNFIYGDGCHFCQYSCQDSCQDCINGICYNYQLQHPLTKMQCDPMIGNELENNSELCNLIGDLYLLSNLYNINFGCDLNCQKCFFKVCQSCNQNYMISTYSKQCTQHTQLFDLVDHCDQQIGNICSKCFDYAYFDIMEQRCKPKSLNINQCQNLMIQVPDQLCNQCFENCIKCSNNDCIKCMEGYYFDDQFQCISYCGDGILTNNEQCEIYDDNCQNCEFQQFQYCLVQFQDTCLQCKYGFHFNFISKICESICRDGQKADDEECEFDNQNIQSGCKYYCSEDCICILEDQQIINAEDLDDTITINNQIFINQNDLNQINNDSDQQNCGNAKFQPSLNEQCDDGNTIGGDGCSETCTNEPFFKCQHFENQQSECSYLEVPDFFLNRLSDEQNSLQIIDLQFSQEIKLNQTNTIENLATYSIEPYTQYKLIVIPLVNLTTELLMPHYQFSIQFQENVDNSKFNIRFKENIIFNSNNIGLKSYNKSIPIGTPFILSAYSQQKLTQMISMNDAIMYTMISIAALAFLIGNPIILFNLLDLLQSFSYIKYIQYKFPPHFSSFLETYSKISLKIIVDFLQIDQFLAELNGGDFPQLKRTASQTTNQINQFNQIFLVNAKSCYISVLTSYITYLIYKLITSKYIDNSLNKFLQSKKENVKYLRIQSLFQNKIQKQCLILKHDYFSKSIFSVYFTILHQLLFSTFIQFPNYSFQSFLDAFNSINSLFAFGLIIYLIFKSLSITSQKIKNRKKWKYFFEESKSKFWASNFKSFQMYRVTIYIFLIVFFYNQPEIQSILLSFQSLCYLIYLCKERPLKSNYEYIKLIFREGIFLTTIGSFLIYSFNLSEDSLLICGWIHISMLITILATNLFVDMIQFIFKLHTEYMKKKLRNRDKLKVPKVPLGQLSIINKWTNLIKLCKLINLILIIMINE